MHASPYGRLAFLPKFLALTLLALAGGCFLNSTPGTELDEHLDSVELYLARGSLMGAEFEQFKLFGQQLYYECGEIKGGRQHPMTQNIAELSAGQLEALKLKAYALLKELRDNKPRFEEAEKSLGFAGPGQLYATVIFNNQPLHVKTALDSISTPSSEAAALLGRLAIELRRQAQELEGGRTLCGNAAFYGLGTATSLRP